MKRRSFGGIGWSEVRSEETEEAAERVCLCVCVSVSLLCSKAPAFTLRALWNLPDWDEEVSGVTGCSSAHWWSSRRGLFGGELLVLSVIMMLTGRRSLRLLTGDIPPSSSSPQIIIIIIILFTFRDSRMKTVPHWGYYKGEVRIQQPIPTGNYGPRYNGVKQTALTFIQRKEIKENLMLL